MNFGLGAALGVGSALGGLFGGSKSSGGDPVTIPAVLDIDDAPERVYSEAVRSPYEPFMPYMFGTGGAGRMFGTPQMNPEYDNYLRTLANGSQGLNTSQMLGGARLGGPPRIYGGPMFGSPQTPNFGGDYFNPYTMPQQMPPILQPSEPQIASAEDEPTPWRLKQDETLGTIPEVWDNRRKTWKPAINLKPSALNSDRYEFVG